MALVDVLADLGGQGAVMVRGTVTAVSTGRLTVLVNGDEFERVNYLRGGWVPVVGDQVYLLSQAGFGVLALGSPEPVDDEPAEASAMREVDPVAVSSWVVNQAGAGSWNVPLTSMTQAADLSSAGVWFYDPADLSPWAGMPLARVEVQLLSISGTVQLMLHRTEAPTGQLEPYGATVTVPLTPGELTWAPLPLSWGRDLLAEDARGLTARSEVFDAVVDLYGTLRFTSL